MNINNMANNQEPTYDNSILNKEKTLVEGLSEMFNKSPKIFNSQKSIADEYKKLYKSKAQPTWKNLSKCIFFITEHKNTKSKSKQNNKPSKRLDKIIQNLYLAGNEQGYFLIYGLLRRDHLFQYFLENLSDKTNINEFKSTLIDIAIKYEKYDHLENMLNLGWEISSINYYLKTILKSKYQSIKMISLLLKYGADVHYDNDSLLAIYLDNCFANEYRYTEYNDLFDIIKLFVEYGINLNNDKYIYYRIIEIYDQFGDRKILKYLLDKGLKITVKSIRLYLQSDKDNLTKILLEHCNDEMWEKLNDPKTYELKLKDNEINTYLRTKGITDNMISNLYSKEIDIIE